MVLITSLLLICASIMLGNHWTNFMTYKRGGLSSSNLAIRVGMKYFF